VRAPTRSKTHPGQGRKALVAVRIEQEATDETLQCVYTQLAAKLSTKLPHDFHNGECAANRVPQRVVLKHFVPRRPWKRADVWTTVICNPGENGQSLHDILFAYLSQTPEGIKLREQGGKQQALKHARERLERAVKGLEDKIASENEVVRQIYKQITPTFDPGDDGIWSEIDLLEGNPVLKCRGY